MHRRCVVACFVVLDLVERVVLESSSSPSTSFLPQSPQSPFHQPLQSPSQASKRARLLHRRAQAAQKKAVSDARNHLLQTAYRTMAAQRAARRSFQEFRNNTQRLHLLADFQSTSHRWVGKGDLETHITPSVFDHRIPIPGLTPHRSEREEAMLAFYSSNARPPLPESVYTALGLAAEAAAAQQERAGLRRELGIDRDEDAERRAAAEKAAEAAAADAANKVPNILFA
jgi:hypothetical protein